MGFGGTVSRLRRKIPSAGWNVAANFAGKISNSVVTLIFVPVYLKYLGVEAWGLVGFHVTIQVTLSLLELGLPASVTREVARCKAVGDSRGVLDIIRFSERTLLLIGGLCALLVAALAHWITRQWLNVDAVPPFMAVASIRAMGLLIAINLMGMVYTATLNALGLQVRLNLVQSASALLRAGLTVSVLAFLSDTVLAYFVAQVIVASVTVSTCRWMALQKIGSAPGQPAPYREVASKIWRFATAMTGNNLLQTLVVQSDKFAVSALLPLAAFGAYSVGWTMTTPISVAAGAISVAIYPVLCQHDRLGDSAAFRRTYLVSSSALGFICWGACLILVFAPAQIIRAWTGDAALAEQLRHPLPIMAVAVALGAANSLATQMYISKGRPGLVLWGTLGCLIIYLPAVLFLTPRYGLSGAAYSQLLYALTSSLLVMPLLHIKSHLGRTYLAWSAFAVFMPAGLWTLFYAGVDKLVSF